MKSLNKFLLLVFLLQIPACKWITSASTPQFFGTNFKLPPGTPTFQQGYKDGCSSILFARGNGFYRSRNSYKYDPQLSNNPEYKFGHSRGMSWCWQNIVGANSMTSPDRSLFYYGNNPVFDMGAGNINDTWDGMFGVGLGAPANPENGGFDAIFKGLSGGDGGGAFSANPLWAGGSKGQIFGQ
jgi:hypothetical protein